MSGRTSDLRKVMRSFLSFSFFKPAKAIFVPGMYCDANAFEVSTILEIITLSKNTPSWGSRGTRIGCSRPR
jgi:hypothetical protein